MAVQIVAVAGVVVMTNQFIAQSSDFFEEVQIAMFQQDVAGIRAYAEPVTVHMKMRNPGAPAEAFLRLRKAEAVSLLDALYNAGIRPSKTYPDDARVEAIQYHLEDMRRLVFEEKSEPPSMGVREV
jgi:hypothetical protein